MNARLIKALGVAVLFSLLFACTREPEPVDAGLLQYVPAEAPYAFVSSKQMPEDVRARLGEHVAIQLSTQAKALKRVRQQLVESPETAEMAAEARQLFDVADAVLAELEGKRTVAELREIGIEPVSRSALFGIGLLPALRIEIADAAKLNATLDRVEKRAGIQAVRGELNGQAYRRIDLGVVDAVLAVTPEHAIFGLLADSLYDADLPLLLGQEMPARSLAQDGEISRLIERHGFTGYGEGYVKLRALVTTMMGRGEGRAARTFDALGGTRLPVSASCMQLVDHMVAGMPRLAGGVSAVDSRHLAVRSVWETNPAVAGHLQKLPAPVAGVGATFEGLMSLGMGIDLPALRNAIDAMLRQIVEAGRDCEWVDPDLVRSVMPQLNLVLGPMTAGIKGFNLQLDELEVDPASARPVNVRASLLAAVDDPRGIFALGAMFNPALAALEVPNDGSLVDLPVPPELDGEAPPMKVAIQDKALLLLAGSYPAGFVHPILSAAMVSPAPLFAVDYGIAQVVERFETLIQTTSRQLETEGDPELAAEMLDQLDSFRQQAEVFDRVRLSVYPSDKGLIMDQVMTFR